MMATLLGVLLDWNFWTAIGTISMAATTGLVIAQNKRQRAEVERQHRDGLRPLCTLTPFDGVDPWYRRDTLLAISDQPAPDQRFGTVKIRCALRNVGLGPALNMKIMFRFLDMNGYLTAPWELAPLRPGEHRGSEDDAIRVPIQFSDHFNQADFSQIVGKAWELILTYEDMFGDHFYSIHHKRPLQLERLYSAPGGSKLSAPLQPWVTFGKGQFA